MPGFPANGTNAPHQHNDQSLQAKIERILINLVNEGLYDAIYLFDESGLPIVQHQKHDITHVYDAETVEISTLMSQIKTMVQQFADFDNLHEILIESTTGKKLIFRYINFFGQTASLVATIPQGRNYRGLTNNLLRTLDRLIQPK